MTTTALFIELLLGGMQTLAWMLVASTIFCGTGHLKIIFSDQSLQSGIILLLTAYSLGVVFDRIWDKLLKKFDIKIRRTIFHNDDRINKIRIKILSDGEIKTDFIDYIRSRMRIARSMVCNFFILFVVSLTAYIINVNQDPASWVLYVIAIELIIFTASFYAYITITQTYYKTLLRLGEHFTK